MTAEIIVLNREGVALAADSAVTSDLGDIEKISSSANKLFRLSNYHPVGIMVYGNSSFMGIPWETIIKLYRTTSLPQVGFPTLDEYAKHFISFLSYKNIKFHDFAQSNYIRDFVLPFLGRIRNIIVKKIETSAKEGKNMGENDVLRLLYEIIDAGYDYHHNLDSLYIPIEQSRTLFSKYHKEIQLGIDIAFDGFNLSRVYRKRIKELLVDAFSKSIIDNVSSGVVIAGFGEKEVLPMVKAFKVEGIVRLQQNETPLEFLKYMGDEDKSSTPDNDAVVIPYAQEEMVCRFMEGVDPDYVEAEGEFLTGLCKDYAHKVVSQIDRYNDAEKRRILQKLTRYGQRLTKEFSKNMEEFAKEYFTDPTVYAVARLTKNELATMAEALVYVTSLKRKVSSDSETVAEPIDVAVISKGDGFVWIKRKHYFEPKLNPLYFVKRYKEGINENYANAEKSDPPAD